MLNEGFSDVKNILDKYQINKFWFLSPKYYEAYIHKICGEYQYENDVAFKNSRFIGIKSFFWQSVTILLGALLSWIKSVNIITNDKIANNGIRIIACPFCWRYVWFKRLPQLIERPMRVVYHPLFHYDYYKKNVEAYDRRYVAPEFYRFGLKDIFGAFYTIIISYNKVQKCSKELSNYFRSYNGKFAKIFVTPILYGGFMKRFIIENKFDDNRRIWLFDYDYQYKYIVFNNIIHRMRKNDITVQIQHGSFISFCGSFCNPISDYSLCCSLREKNLIEQSNVFHSKPYILGAPLQTFDDVNKKKLDIKYDILILLTISDDRYYCSMKNILLNKDIQKYKIKVRYRPTSKKRDMKALSPYTTKMEISENTTLLDDVLMSKMVICFSEDALYTAIRYNKPIIYIRDIDIEKNYDMSAKSRFFQIINSQDFSEADLDFMIKHRKECDYTNDNSVIYNFGYFQLDDIQTRLNCFIKEILSSDGSDI